MANPRKFSEKIALHLNKQAEETAAFEQIMREVIGATRVPVVNQNNGSNASSGTTLRNNHLYINQSVANCRAGSLPNVNHIGNENSIDLKSALHENLMLAKDVKSDDQGRHSSRERRNVSPVAGRNHHVGGHHSRSVHSSEHKRQDASPYSTPYLSPPDVWRRTNSDSALHQSALLAEQDNSNPYQQLGSPASPRRALHQSMVNTGHSGQYLGHGNMALSWDPGKQRQDYSQYSTSPEQTVLLTPQSSEGDGSRPKSCEVPGITIYPTQEDPNGHHQIPLSSNTGSLPDLTSLHFPAPLSTPIDLDDQSGQHQATTNAVPTSNNHSQQPQPYAPPPSPYSTASNCGSPYSPQSPNSVHSAHSQHSHHSTFSPPPVGQSPSSNTTTNHNNHHHLAGGGILYDAQQQFEAMADNSGQLNSMNAIGGDGIPSMAVHQQQQGNHNQMQRQQHGLTMGTSALSLGSNTSYAPGVSHSTSQPVFTATTRPQSSVPQGQYVPQTVQQQSMGLHRSATPSEHSCSAPNSPISHTISPLNSPGQPPSHNGPNSNSSTTYADGAYTSQVANQQTHVLQHQLEQFKMVHDLGTEADHLLMMPESVHSSSSSASSSTAGLHYTTANHHHHGALPHESPRGSVGDSNCDYSPQASPQSNFCVTTATGLNDLHGSNVFYSSAAMLSMNNVPSNAPSSIYSAASKQTVISSSPSYQQQPVPHQRQPIHSPAPQTPTSIPDIILTDANAEESLLRQADFTKELASHSMSSFDTNDLFSADAFKSDIPIDPIDFDGLQILTEMTDSPSEENFRLDRV